MNIHTPPPAPRNEAELGYNKERNNKCWDDEGKFEYLYMVGRNAKSLASWEESLAGFLKLKTELTFDLAISLRGIYPEE